MSQYKQRHPDPNKKGRDPPDGLYDVNYSSLVISHLVSSSTTMRPRGKRKGKRTEMNPTEPVLPLGEYIRNKIVNKCTYDSYVMASS